MVQATRPRLAAHARVKLRACLDALESGDRGGAVAIARVFATDPHRTSRFVGVRLLYLLRLYQEALDSLHEYARSRPDDGYAPRLCFALLKRLRFEQEADAALGQFLRTADGVRVREAAVLHYQAMGRPRTALTHLAHVLRVRTDSAHRYRGQLRLAVEAGDPETTRRAAERALQLDPTSWPQLVDTLLEGGCFELVERQAQRHVDSGAGRAVLGQIALYRGAWSAAYGHASVALQRDRGCERAVVVMVGASIMDGELDRAEHDLGNWSGDVSPTLRTWRAELALRRSDLAGAKRELMRVQNEVPDYLAAKLLWVIVKGELDREQWVTMSAYDGLLEGQLQVVGLGVRVENDLIDAKELQDAARCALARLGGNRSPFPTVMQDGQLTLIHVPASARHRVRRIQHRAPWIGLERVKAEIGAALARVGPHPVAQCYEAELDLWSGDYDVAREKFAGILANARRTTWAWIGLGASQVLLGDPAGGLRSLDEGVHVMGWRGATLPVYRGEALFRLGRFDEAAGELREACATHPRRVAAWVLRVLVEHARGQAVARDAAFAHLDRSAPALLADAARVTGSDGWWPGVAPAETQLRVAQSALALMRGNRSSSCPLWIAPGSDMVRSVVPERPVTMPDWEANERRILRTLA